MTVLIESITAYASSRYNKKIQCEECCNNGCITQGDCSKCLNDIFNANSTRNKHYKCMNIVDCYVAKYMYRYSSEIVHLLCKEPFEEFVKSIENISVCSIGCGSCSDFIAFSQFMREKEIDMPFLYTGFDLQDNWSHIHGFIQHAAPGYVDFNYANVFEYYRDEENYPNVFILNYVLSDIVKYKNESINEFIDDLCDLFKRSPNRSCIVINDINHYMVRKYYDTINNQVKSYSIAYGFHFPNTWKFANRHKSNKLTSKIPQYLLPFDPPRVCGSSQFIIVKK